MKRIQQSSASSTLPASAETGAVGYFTDGDPESGVAATVVTPEWLNRVQEELCYVIEESGLTLDGDDNTQLYQAIQTVFSTAASETVAGVVELATDAEVQAGTDTERAVTPAGLNGMVSRYSTGEVTMTPVVSSINGGQLAGMRNKIINGAMTVAQRGTSFAAASGYTIDQYNYYNSSSGVVTITQSSDVPSGNEFQSSLRIAVTTADATMAASDLSSILQVIEGYSARDLIGRTFTLSFWVRSSKTGTHCVSFKNSGSDRSYVSEYTVNAANTWEKKTISVSGGLITAGTWGWTNGIGLQVCWVLASGSTYHATAGSWQTGNYSSTSNQVNCLDTVGNIFAITGVQLEVGSVATPFEHRFYGSELALCQRYYTTGTATQYGYITNGFLSSQSSFKVSMRASPTIVVTDSGSNVTFNSQSVTADRLLRSYTGSSSNVNAQVNFSYTASAEL